MPRSTYRSRSDKEDLLSDKEGKCKEQLQSILDPRLIKLRKSKLEL